MAILTRKFASGIWSLREYRKELLDKEAPAKDFTEDTRNDILKLLDEALSKLTIINEKYRLKGMVKPRKNKKVSEVEQI